MSISSSVEQNLSEMQLNGFLLPTKVFVGGLAEKTETKDLRELFSEYAAVNDVKIIVDRSVISKSGDPRRYAFVQFDTPEEVNKVLTELKDKSLDLHGRRLTVGQAFRKPQVSGPGRLLSPSVVPALMNAVDPYGLYRALSWNCPKPMPMTPPPGPYAYPYGYPYYAPEMSMAYSGMMNPQMMSGYSMSGSMSAPSSPIQNGASVPGHHMTSVPSSPLGYTTIKNVMSSVGNGLDNNYACMQPNGTGSCTNSMDDGSSDMFLYKSQQMATDTRQRSNGRVMNMPPQPVRVQQNGQQPGQHYVHQGPLQASTLSPDNRFINPALRHQYVQ